MRYYVVTSIPKDKRKRMDKTQKGKHLAYVGAQNKKVAGYMAYSKTGKKNVRVFNIKKADLKAVAKQKGGIDVIRPKYPKSSLKEAKTYMKALSKKTKKRRRKK